MAGCAPGTWGSCTAAICTSPGAPRRSSSSTGRTIIRTIWRRSRSARRGWSSARSWPPACAAAEPQTEQLVVFVLHRGGHGGVPAARHAGGAAHQRADRARGREVVPVKRIPKTTSGKIQRHLLEESYARRRVRCRARGARGAARRAARARAQRSRNEIEKQAEDHLRHGPRRQARGHPRQSVRGGRELAEAHRDPRADRPRVIPARST